MDLKFSVVCIVLMTIWRITEAQTIETNTSKNLNEDLAKKFIEEHDDSNPKPGREGLRDSKQASELKLTHSANDIKTTKVQNLSPKSKSAQVPPNLASDKKSGISAKRPIFIKISNIKANPAKDKTQTVRRKKPQINLGLKVGTPRRKVAAHNNTNPKAAVVIKKVKQTPPKTNRFYEEEVENDDIKYFSPVTKLPTTTEDTKPTTDSTLLNKLKSKEVKIEAGISLQKDVGQSKDRTPDEHTKQSPKYPDSRETDHAESSKAHQNDKPQLLFIEESEPHRSTTIEPKVEEPALSAPKNEQPITRTTNVPEKTITSNAAKNEPVSRTYPMSGEKDDLPEIITIRNYEHKEIEERYGSDNPDERDETNTNEDINKKWTPKTITSPDSENTYKYQSLEQNLGNEYPYQGDVTTCDYINTRKSDYSQDYRTSNTSPSEVQMYPNVFQDWPQPQNNAMSPQNQNNVMWSQPQNNAMYPQHQNNAMWHQFQNNAIVSPILTHPKVAGRTWKTWKDTEINIRKLNNKLNPYGNNIINSGATIVPVSYKNPVIGLNGYYDNLNNQFTYAYPSYRYNM